MGAARAHMAEALDVALQDAGLRATTEAVDKLVEAVADSLEVIAGESVVRQEAWDTPVRRPLDPKAEAGLVGPYWSRRTLEGLALMLRRRA